MTVYYLDILSPCGHVNYNKGILRSISRNYPIKAYLSNYMIEQLENLPNISFHSLPSEIDMFHVKNKCLNKSLFRVFWRFRLLKFLINFFTLPKNGDIIVLGSVELYSFIIASIFTKNKILLIDHGIGKIFSHKLYRLGYKLCIRSNVQIIVLESYIQKELLRFLNRKIYLLHHPLPDTITNKIEQDNIFIFAPAGQNCESFIDELIQCSNLIPAKVRIMIKSRFRSLTSGQLQVYNSHLTDKEYIQLLSEAKYVLLPYDKKYLFRTSAVFFEALKNKKKILIYNNNTLMNYVYSYPDICHGFNNVMDLFELLGSDTGGQSVHNYDEIISQYDDMAILKQFSSIINS